MNYTAARGLRLGTYALMDGPPGSDAARPQFLDGRGPTSRSVHWQRDVDDLARSGVDSGLGHIVALYCRSSPLYQIH